MLALVLSSPLEEVTSQGGNAGVVKDNWQRAYSSWALGVVVPDGARLDGGGALSWKTATNLTAVARLPNITNPAAITYVVLSAMGNDRTIFQVAAGTWPDCSYWSVYSWFITGVDSRSPAYECMANSTGPEFSPHDVLSISIFIASPSAWMFRVTDENRSSSLERSFPTSLAVSFASGDQEVFSLESYSRSASTFQNMGNQTLESLLVDGTKVLDGWYPYSGWDPAHNPLFVVGGSAAPLFIDLTTNGRGEAVWAYSPQWADAHLNVSLGSVVVGLALFSLIVVSALFVRNGRRSRVKSARTA